MYTVIASLLLAAGPPPLSPEAWLESELRRRNGAVTEWHIREVGSPSVPREMRAETFELGSVGARTLVVVHGRDSFGRPAVAHCWYAVTGLRPGLVTTRSLNALSTIGADMVTLSSIDVLAAPCDPLNDASAAVGLRLLQSRHRGDTLCAAMLGPVPAVARGAIVSVQVVAGAVALSTEAVARNDAYIGDRVQLYRSAERSSFWGVVTAPGEARIDE